MATAMEGMTDKGTLKGFIYPGEAFHVTPYNTRTEFDLTAPVGKISGTLISYFFYLGKRGFKERYKVEDIIEVSPVHAQYYQLTIQQKQQLERQIKEGLASISQTVADLELLWHDLRKYREYIEMLEAVKKGKAGKGKTKEEMEKDQVGGVKAEQTLKAVFIDEVDVHTDLPQTPISLRQIVNRWPTIISDFMKLSDDDDIAGKIREKLKVSEAECVVLATKNKIYKRWKDIFESTIRTRYENIARLVESRRASVEEYKRMLQPYVRRYRSIQEMGQTERGRETLKGTAFFRSSAQAVSLDYTLTWAWRPIMPAEFAKPSREAYAGEEIAIDNIRKLPFGKNFNKMVAENVDFLKSRKIETIKLSPTGVEPLDDFVFKHYPAIEKKYGVEFSIEDILKVRDSFCSKDYNTIYFMTMEIGATRSVFRTPSGSELEDLILNPFYMYFDTQNVILLRMLELKAIELDNERYVERMLGEVDKKGVDILQALKNEYPYFFNKGGEEGSPIEKTRKEIFEKKENKPKPEKEEKKPKSIMEVLDDLGLNVSFVKKGPYETHFEDRVTGVWFPDMLGSVYLPSVAIFKAAMQVPGFKVPI